LSDLIVTLNATDAAAIDWTKGVKIKTVNPDAVDPANLPKDKNGQYYQPNTAGIPVTVTETLNVASISATLNTGIASGDKIEIVYNLNINPETIKKDWDGTEKTDATFSIASNGVLTVEGYNVGSISGFNIDPGTSVTLTGQKIAYDASNKKLTLTFDGADVVKKNILANGELRYTPASGIKTLSGTDINTSITAAVVVDANPMLRAARLVDIDGDKKFKSVGDKLELTFSEPVFLNDTKLKATGTSLGDLNAAIDIDPAGGTTKVALAGTTPTFKVTADGVTVTIEIEAAALTNTEVEAGKATINTGDLTTTKEIKDSAGNGAAARSETWVKISQ
jgi:hypothetical protein